MKVLKRGEIQEKYKWRVEDIFKDDDAFFAELDGAAKETGILSGYKGRLSDKTALLECLRAEEGLSKRLNLLGLYAHMKKDEDTKNVKYAAMYDRLIALSVKISSEASFITPEISAFDDGLLTELIADKAFGDFDYMFKEILRNKAHILSEKEEKL
ncbi:MAG: oligoendopeptidase F, partial [Clostridiales bacterium]|nr:oligoendopeptidase F [Clostridiales bacterium]